MLPTSIAAPCPIDAANHLGAPVVRLRLPLPLSVAELVAALFTGVPPDCEPEQLSDAEVLSWIVQAVVWDGMAAVHRHPLPTDEGGHSFLVACDRRIARYLATQANRHRRRSATARRPVAA